MCVLWFLETIFVIKIKRLYRTRYGKDRPTDNAIRRWLKKLQETDSALHREGAGRPSNSQEDIDRIQELFLEAHKNHLDELLCS
jgi:hypothetical protein